MTTETLGERLNSTLSWENVLLVWADQCADEYETASGIDASAAELEIAYRACAAVTAEHSRTFSMASALLPAPKRRAVRALYAFCRRTDDLVDRAQGDAQTALETWRVQSLSTHPRRDDPIALAWADTRTRYRIPQGHAEQLVDGVRRDLRQNRYATFDELARYAYGVSSTVGLMSAHIIGFSGPEAIPYAVKLGVALQMTNILRDIVEDWRAGRLYLLLDELAAFDLSEHDIAAGRISAHWQAFMDFQIARNRGLYALAWPGIAMLNRDGRFAIGAAAILYQGILDDIAAHGGDVFTRCSHVGKWGKLRRLPGVWLRTRG
jgi:phytoene synthase